MTRNLTEGNPAKMIFLFTIPLFIGNLFQQLYSMADTLIVGRTLGVNALASVGCTGSISFLIIGFVQGLTSGLSILTAQRFGAGDTAGVRRSVATSILLSAVITVVLTAAVVPLVRGALELMQTPASIIDDAYRYIVVICWGIGASMLFNLLSNIIRALGDSRTPLIFLAVACVVNIGLDYLFILTFHMGVGGAGLATVIAQILSGILCIFYIAKKFPILHLKREDFKIKRQSIKSHLRVGLPMGIQTSIIAIGSVILQTALNSLGETSVAAFTAAGKIDQLGIQPMMSFGITMATYAAQNYGAEKMHNIRRGVFQCVLMSGSFSIFICMINIFFGKYLVALFVGADQTEVISLAQIYLSINGACYLLLSMLFIYRYTLQGLGKSFIPTLAGFIELGMRIVAALVLSRVLGFAGASMSSPLAWLGALIPIMIAYFATMRHLDPKLPRSKTAAVSQS